jgi:hypothetical protein
LQAAAFYMHLAPHMGHPLMNRRHTSEPIGLNWGMPNPDFDYTFGYLDGKRRYRIYGPHKSTNDFFDLIVFNGYFVANLKTYFQGALNKFETKDGGVEVFLGPASNGPNHINLDPDEPHNFFTIREALEDWTTQKPTPLRIECVDPPETLGPFLYPEADLVVRLGRAAELVRQVTRRTMANYKSVLASTGGKENVFFVQGPSPERANNNAHPEHTQGNAVYNLKPGQSLIIETEMPRTAAYWGLQTADLWWRSADWTWRQTSLNRRNAWFGADGVFRAVVSRTDPGVQNWLDVVDNDYGRLLLRMYRASDAPQPRTLVTSDSEVLKHLPADTPRFTPAQRKAQIAARTEASLERYGY